MVLKPFYPKGEGRGQLPMGLVRMLRLYIVKQCLGLPDEGIEDAVYDSQAIRRFIGIDLNVDTARDATTLLKFRRLLETHNLIKMVLDTINSHLAAKGLLLRKGTVADAPIIAAPPSKNKAGECGPDMHQTKKGNEWHCRKSAHIGVNADSGLVQPVVTTAANVHGVTQAHALLHGEATHAFGNAGYTSVTKGTE
jgi:IS5 family transposase